MDSKTYIANAIKTESVPAVINLNVPTMYVFLDALVAMSTVADQLKRKLYYGKDFDTEKLNSALHIASGASGCLIEMGEDGDFAKTEAEIASSINTSNKHGAAMLKSNAANLNIRLLHGALGIFGESGEMLEALFKQFKGEGLDLVNMREEVGDTQWYTAILCDELKADLDVIRDTNIGKLRSRYPNAFDANKAIDRNIAAEREVLEA